MPYIRFNFRFSRRLSVTEERLENKNYGDQGYGNTNFSVLLLNL